MLRNKLLDYTNIVRIPLTTGKGFCRYYSKTNINNTSKYKRWFELTKTEKQSFIRAFVDNYKKQYPKSRTNLSLRELSNDMTKFDDSPSVFGIFYNDIWKEVTNTSKSDGSNKHAQGDSRFAHPTFKTLLIDVESKQH
ncbi:hypothetical protein KAFR_0B03840 [Kazachstania africana CBS 2517]|uniref:Uncharacterized protein n=1 Tax=Kazachstania africana (strain ATCC 22294 / BCRC 22015 / CBS 2517 / CECT 1963 / NBRC 1671 / NRRL Y-8276) TaxID=1071382 RepID=H2AQN0_KAZAF|nr:hypothetical protein KAFR_0B03840 [Kazachstania africana CBS 2517]CCF56680.1 hypothetical protein KAFR_0B03840 [Kazachstania africana CBS 2517]